MQPLLRMLHSPTSDTQRNSAKALELLTRHYQCRTALVEADGERGGEGRGGDTSSVGAVRRGRERQLPEVDGGKYHLQTPLLSLSLL